MAEKGELMKALESSKIRLLPLEEHLFITALSELDRKIQEALAVDKEVRSPYELS